MDRPHPSLFRDIRETRQQMNGHAASVFFALGVPPFSSQLHPVFTFFPLLSFFICVPLFLFSLHPSLRRAMLQCYLFGVSASALQFYWIAFVVPEKLWPLILAGVVLITLFEALFFLALGLLFRYTRKNFPVLNLFLFPSLWVCIDYARCLGEMSFPWNLVGYSLAPLLPLAQIASITGMFGLTFMVIFGNVCVWNAASSLRRKGSIGRVLPLFAVFLLVISLAGFFRMKHPFAGQGHGVKVAILQCNLDQNHWGNSSLDTSFQIVEALARKASLERPDLIVMPESALLCYLLKSNVLKERVRSWVISCKIPMIVGALHWEPAPPRSGRDYLVYNTAFYLDSAGSQFVPYYKMKLVPFSETLPFQGVFPLLSRVNLGQADFSAGKNPAVFRVGETVKAAPFICYEIIYPSFVRERVVAGATMLVNITNDGWFGRSSGAFQHATMARLRCIENGVALARAANSGISMLVDPYGRIIAETELYKRTCLFGELPPQRIRTLYTRFGDWPVWASALCIAMAVCMAAVRRRANPRAPGAASPKV